MVNGIVVNGVWVNTPGAYGEAYFPPTIGNTVVLKSLAILAELPYLPQALPIQVTSKEAFDRLMPGDLELLRLSSITYSPANDERVPGGPASVWLVNVRPTTQAFIELDDGAGNPGLRLESTVWGPKGNQTFVSVAEDAGVYELTVRRDGVVESYTGLQGESLFALQYVDTDLTTCTAEYTPGGDFVISGTKTLIALGLFTPTVAAHPWDGIVTIDPSLTPGVGESFAAVVTGINTETGVSDTETLTFLPAGLGAAQSTTKSFSSLTTISFTATDGSPTFTLSGEVLRAEPTEVATVGALVDLLSSAPYSTAGVGPAFTITAVSSLVGSVRLDQIDPIPTATSLLTAYTVKNVVQTLVLALGASSLVTAEAVAGGGAPIDYTDERLLGGSAGSTDATDWDAAFTALRGVPVRVIAPMSDSASIHTKARNHAIHMAGPGAYDCNVWVGAAAQETLAQLGARTQLLNSRSVSLVGQEIERESPLGTLEWLSPKYFALMCAAMQCGTRLPVTAKIPGITGFRQHSSWTPDADKTDAHNKRVTIIGQTLGEQGVSAPTILRALSTFWLSSDPCRTDVRPVESTSELLIFTRSHFRQYVGTNTTTAPTSVITKEWLAVLRRAKDLGIIGDYDAASARAIRVGNVTTLRATIVPVFSNDFFKIEIGVVPTLQGGGTFQLALAA